jgi:hypothetical protein
LPTLWPNAFGNLGKESKNRWIMNIPISDRSIQNKFKYTADFGVSENYNLQTAASFAAAIQANLQKQGVQEIAGTYRRKSSTILTH